MNIQDHVAVISCDPFAPDRLTAQLRKLPRDVAPRHWDDFYREREGAKDLDFFAFVGNAYKVLRHRSNDLFARKGCPTALNELQLPIGFIGSININGPASPH